MRFARSSGILLHLTSLPSRFGIGDLGPEAYRFVDFLADSKQSLWQMLPLGPTSSGNLHSPYVALSAFAGNPLLISPEVLVEDGLIPVALLDSAPIFPAGPIEYDQVSAYKREILQTVAKHFANAASK